MSNPIYDGPWRNRIHHLYTQYCDLDQCPPKLLKLLDKFGAAFNDHWYFKICGRTRKVVTRRPLWLDRGEGGWLAEKPKVI